MIYGEEKVESPVDLLRASRFTFYPTGSRAWGTSNEDSDYDFFTEDTEDIRHFLENNGFKQISEGPYCADPTLSAVYRKKNVDVQLCSHLAEKMNIQAVLAAYMPRWTKEQQTAAWWAAHLVYRVYI